MQIGAADAAPGGFDLDLALAALGLGDVFVAEVFVLDEESARSTLWGLMLHALQQQVEHCPQGRR